MTKLAVVVGCNYRGKKGQLKGCVNDAHAMWDMLTTLSGFQPSDINLLTDDTPIKPTYVNINQALHEMFNKAKRNDQLFFYFSGHGTILHSEDEAIVCLDHYVITKHEFRQLVNRLPESASFQMVADSCTSGGLIDKEQVQIGPSRTSTTRRSRAGTIPHDSSCKVIPFESIIENLCASTGDRTSDVNALMGPAFGDQASLRYRQSEDELASSRPLRSDEGILLSACRSNEQARERPFNGIWYGAFTHALIQMAQSDRCAFGCSHEMVVTTAAKELKTLGLVEQHPCLYCSDLNTELCFIPMRFNPFARHQSRYLRALSQIIKWGRKLFNNLQCNRK